MTLLAKKHRLPRGGENAMSTRARNPLDYKGLRVRFRTLLRKVAAGRAEGLRFRTDIERRPVRLVVIVTAGSADAEHALRGVVEGTFFEGLPVTVVRGSR